MQIFLISKKKKKVHTFLVKYVTWMAATHWKLFDTICNHTHQLNLQEHLTPKQEADEEESLAKNEEENFEPIRRKSFKIFE